MFSRACLCLVFLFVRRRPPLWRDIVTQTNSSKDCLRQYPEGRYCGSQAWKIDRTLCALIGEKLMFYQSIKQIKSVLLFRACKIYIVKQMKKPKPFIKPLITTLRTFESTREMLKTRACGSCFFTDFHRVLNVRRVLTQTLQISFFFAK